VRHLDLPRPPHRGRVIWVAAGREGAGAARQ
jgi:hypothetical protein